MIFFICMVSCAYEKDQESFTKLDYVLDRGFISDNISRIIYKKDSLYNYYIQVNNLDSSFVIGADYDCVKSTFLCKGDLIEESGKLFNLGHAIGEWDNKSVVKYNKVNLSQVLKGVNIDDIKSEICYEFQVKEEGKSSEYVKYYFDKDLMILLKWEYYLNDSLSRSMTIVNIDRVKSDFIKGLKCRNYPTR